MNNWATPQRFSLVNSQENRFSKSLGVIQPRKVMDFGLWGLIRKFPTKPHKEKRTGFIVDKRKLVIRESNGENPHNQRNCLGKRRRFNEEKQLRGNSSYFSWSGGINLGVIHGAILENFWN